MLSREMSADTRALANLLAAVPIEGSISYGTMSDTLGRQIENCRHTLYAAMKVAMRESGAVFVNTRDVGYRRIRPDEAPALGYRVRRHIRRSSRQARTAIGAAVNGANDLSPILQRAVSAETNTLSLLEHISRDHSVKAMADKSDKPQPVAVTARAFLEHIGAIPKTE